MKEKKRVENGNLGGVNLEGTAHVSCDGLGLFYSVSSYKQVFQYRLGFWLGFRYISTASGFILVLVFFLSF